MHHVEEPAQSNIDHPFQIDPSCQASKAIWKFPVAFDQDASVLYVIYLEVMMAAIWDTLRSAGEISSMDSRSQKVFRIYNEARCDDDPELADQHGETDNHLSEPNDRGACWKGGRILTGLWYLHRFYLPLARGQFLHQALILVNLQLSPLGREGFQKRLRMQNRTHELDVLSTDSRSSTFAFSYPLNERYHLSISPEAITSFMWAIIIIHYNVLVMGSKKAESLFMIIAEPNALNMIKDSDEEYNWHHMNERGEAPTENTFVKNQEMEEESWYFWKCICRNCFRAWL